MERVKWIREYEGRYYPSCPYCNEPAYEDNICVFCGREYTYQGVTPELLCNESGCHHKCHDTRHCIVEEEAELINNNIKENRNDYRRKN